MSKFKISLEMNCTILTVIHKTNRMIIKWNGLHKVNLSLNNLVLRAKMGFEFFKKSF